MKHKKKIADLYSTSIVEGMDLDSLCEFAKDIIEKNILGMDDKSLKADLLDYLNIEDEDFEDTEEAILENLKSNLS